MNNNIKVKNIVPKCGADFLMPFGLMYMFYVILHGHLSPGGGFQGGVLMVATVVLLYLGYGYKITCQALSLGFMHKAEGFASLMYVLIAMLGVIIAGNFCQNVFFESGDIGDLFSAGTIFWMNMAVGVKVLTGVGVLGLSMLGLIAYTEEEKE